MKKIFLTALLVFISALIVNCGTTRQAMSQDKPNSEEVKTDTLNMPVIQIKPMVLEAKRSEGQFIVRDVKVLNRGGSTLHIKKVTGSCKCSSATVLDGAIEPMTIGKIRLNVNLEGFEADDNTAEFIVESDAKNSPVIIKIIVVE